MANYCAKSGITTAGLNQQLDAVRIMVKAIMLQARAGVDSANTIEGARAFEKIADEARAMLLVSGNVVCASSMANRPVDTVNVPVFGKR